MSIEVNRYTRKQPRPAYPIFTCLIFGPLMHEMFSKATRWQYYRHDGSLASASNYRPIYIQPRAFWQTITSQSRCTPSLSKAVTAARVSCTRACTRLTFKRDFCDGD